MSKIEEKDLPNLKKDKPYLFIDGRIPQRESKQLSDLFKKDIEKKKLLLAEMVLHKAETSELADYIREAERFYKIYLEASFKFMPIDEQIKTLKILKNEENK